MDGGKENTSPIFRSDDVLNSKSSSKNNNFFVKVTKNPLLRWLLRSKQVEEKPKPQPITPPIKPVVKKPKPQFRTTIRLSTKKLKASKKTKLTILFLSSLVILLCATAGYFGYNYFLASQKKTSTSDFSVSKLRSELLDLVKSSDTNSDNIANVIQALDEKINLVTNIEDRRSLKVYKLFLLADIGYNVEAVEYFNSIKEEPFSESQLCELYEYRVLISKTSSSSDDAEVLEKYQQICGITKEPEDEKMEEEIFETEQGENQILEREENEI